MGSTLLALSALSSSEASVGRLSSTQVARIIMIGLCNLASLFLYLFLCSYDANYRSTTSTVSSFRSEPQSSDDGWAFGDCCSDVLGNVHQV